ncbi:MAG TPA: hypothetical protein P5531_00740 [Bacteroidales bacterium]|nr:hypothetical protein [Bacteroidales bacterium]HSA42182.1 hypothetical protein [Bacteroidales bacterium]
MKTSLYVLCVILLCGLISPAQAQQAERTLIAVDKAFDRMAQDIGIKPAFMHYACDSLIKMNHKAKTITGKPALEAWLNTLDPQLPLRWKPVKAEISKSGDLGYTYGWWRLPSSDTTYYGNYVTIWKKLDDGQWKFVLDAGTSTPKPEGIIFE